MKITVSIETPPFIGTSLPSEVEAHEQEAREDAGAMLDTISTQLRDGYREGHLASQGGTRGYWSVEW